MTCGIKRVENSWSSSRAGNEGGKNGSVQAAMDTVRTGSLYKIRVYMAGTGPGVSGQREMLGIFTNGEGERNGYVQVVRTQFLSKTWQVIAKNEVP